MRKATGFFVSIVITAVLMWLLLSKVRVADVFSVLSKTNLTALGICLAFYLLMMLIRTWRFNLLLKNKILTGKLFWITLFYNFVNNLVPFRIGEFSYVYLVKKATKKFSPGIASLLISRVFDFIALAFVFIIALYFSKFSLFSPYIIAGFVIALIVVAFILIYKIDTMLLPIQKFAKVIAGTNKGLSKNILGFSNDLAKAFSEIKSKKIMFETFLSSVAITLLSMIFTFYLVLSVGYYLPINVLIIATIASILTTILPIYGLGGFGTVEAAWVIVLTYFGYATETAVVLSFSVHIIQLVFSALLGLAGWLGLKWKK
jgi:uncharacterized protein (TIRG00374 family)